MSIGRQAVGHPVDVASGTMYSTHRDYTISGRVELNWERRYSTALLDSSPGPFGPGWTTRYLAMLTRLPGEYRFVTPDGDVDNFSDPGGEVERGGIVRNFGTFQELMKIGEKYVVVRWEPDSEKVERYVFLEAKPGEAMPLCAIEDVTGQGLDMLREKSGRLIGVRQRLEMRSLAIEYNSAGQIHQVVFASESSRGTVLARYDYHASGQIAAAYDALGAADRYEYDETGRMTRELVKDGAVFSFRYDQRGRCVKTWGLDRYDEKSLRYHDAIGWTDVTDSTGATSRFQWKPTGQIVARFDPNGSVWQTEYDAHGRIAKTIDAMGGAWSYQYDEAGNRSAVTDALEQTIAIEFNSQRLPVKIINARGDTWQRRYDSSNRIVQTIDPDGAEYQINYHGGGNTMEVRSPLGGRKFQEYSATGVLKTESDWLGNRTAFEFDAFGRMTRRVGPLGDVTKLTYDSLGNPRRIQLPDGANIEFGYDVGGNLSYRTDGLGRTTRFRYGSCDRLLERIEPDGRSVKYKWGTEPRRLLAILNEKGERYEQEYDLAGNVKSIRWFDGREERFEHDRVGRRVAVTTPNGDRIQIERDLLGRMVKQITSDGAVATFNYDVLGNLIEVANKTSTVQFQRDHYGRIVHEAQGAIEIAHRYDLDGNLTTSSSSLEHRIAFSHDRNGGVTRTVINDFDPVEYVRDAYGRETSRVLATGVQLAQSYDIAGRLKSQAIVRGSQGGSAGQVAGARQLWRTYEYDAHGSTTEINDGRWGAARFTYDSSDRLIKSDLGGGEMLEYGFDATNNLTEIKRVSPRHETQLSSILFGPGNRLKSLNNGKEVAFKLDAAGRLTQRVEFSPGVPARSWTFEWDSLNQLTRLRTPSDEVWTYEYDGLGRRTAKSNASTQFRYVWDEDALLHEVHDEEVTTWACHPGQLSPSFSIQGGRLLHVVRDQLGTPRELFEQYDRVLWAGRVLPWGDCQIQSQGDVSCDLRYPGQLHDPESGLHYNRFRYYDPLAGRYASPDPLGAVAGANDFQYTTNPVNWIDPLGLACTQIEPKMDDPPMPVTRSRLEMRDGKWVTVSPSGQVRTAKGNFIFVTQNGQTYVTNPNATIGGIDGRPVYHTDVGGGRPVDYAGEVRFSKSGQLTGWTNRSGHYQPPADLAHQAGLPMGSFTPVPDS